MFLLQAFPNKKKNITQIGRSALVVAVISLLISAFFPLQYKAETQLLVLPKHTTADPYVSLKSAERTGDTLTHIITTDSFFRSVEQKKATFSLDTAQFEEISEQKKRKRWKKLVSGNVMCGTAVIQLQTYHKNKDQAVAYGKAISAVLAKEAQSYTGTVITIKEISTPIVSRFPVRLNLLLNALFGAVIGGLGMAVWQRRKDIAPMV